MYKLEYLPIAMQDMVGIIGYISNTLSNPTAADRLAIEMVGAVDRLKEFPYLYPLYRPLKPLKYEYRRLPVRNYLIFYYVDEMKKLIAVARAVYARQNYTGSLDQR